MTQLDNFKFFQENINWKEVSHNILTDLFEQRRIRIQEEGRRDIERMTRIMGGEAMFQTSSFVIPFRNVDEQRRVYNIDVQNIPRDQIDVYIHALTQRIENPIIPIVDYPSILR
jgi:hypothetical protein